MDKPLPTKLQELVDEKKHHVLVSDMLSLAKKQGAHEAEICISTSCGLSVSVRRSEIDKLEFNKDNAFGITVYKEGRKGSASTTDLSLSAIQSTIQAALFLADFTESDACHGLAEKSGPCNNLLDLDVFSPWNISCEEAIDLAKKCEEMGYAYDSKIVNSEGAFVNTHLNHSIYGNTRGFLQSYGVTRHELSCSLIAKDQKGSMEHDYDFTIATHASLLENPEIIGTKAAEKAIARLNSRKIKTQKAKILFQPRVAATLWSHLIAAISGTRQFKKNTFLLDSLHKKMFPDFLHLYEEPHLLRALGSAPFDTEGVLTTSKYFVQGGIIENYLLSAYSSKKLGLENTGNAGGVHNLCVRPTDGNFKDILKKMDTGVLVTQLMGDGVNLVTGHYSRGVTGFWVENGEIQFPISEITIAGNLKEMFLQILAIGNDIDTRGNYRTGSVLIDNMMVAGN